MRKQKTNFSVDMVVEIPKGSYIKYEFDKEKQALRVDRILHATPYPFNYGYIPDTLSGDGDPLDIILLSNHSLHPYTLVKVKVIDVLMTEDEKGLDAKMIALMADDIDPSNKNIDAINNEKIHAIHGQLIAQIKHFFEHYKDLEQGKWVKVHGFYGLKKAKEVYDNSIIKKS